MWPLRPCLLSRACCASFPPWESSTFLCISASCVSARSVSARCVSARFGVLRCGLASLRRPCLRLPCLPLGSFWLTRALLFLSLFRSPRPVAAVSLVCLEFPDLPLAETTSLLPRKAPSGTWCRSPVVSCSRSRPSPCLIETRAPWRRLGLPSPLLSDFSPRSSPLQSHKASIASTSRSEVGPISSRERPLARTGPRSALGFS